MKKLTKHLGFLIAAFAICGLANADYTENTVYVFYPGGYSNQATKSHTGVPAGANIAGMVTAPMYGGYSSVLVKKGTSTILSVSTSSGSNSGGTTAPSAGTYTSTVYASNSGGFSSASCIIAW